MSGSSGMSADAMADELSASQRFGFHRSNVEMKETLEELSSSHEFAARFCCLKGWFVRAGWHVKLAFLLDAASLLPDDLRAQLARLSGLGLGKDFAYLRSQDLAGPRGDAPLGDSSRCLGLAVLEDLRRLDGAWLVTLKESRRVALLGVLLTVGGAALRRKVHEVLRQRADRLRRVTAILEQIPQGEEDEPPGPKRGDAPQLDGDDLTALDKDWLQRFQEVRDCYVRRMQGDDQGEEVSETSRRQSEFFKEPFVLLNEDQLQKMETEMSPPSDPKEAGDKVYFDQIMFLPEPINMVIFGYLDKEALKVARQVSPYWAFIADEVDKERAARAKVNASLARLTTHAGAKKPEKKGRKRKPAPCSPPAPLQATAVPPPPDPEGREKVALLLKLFKPPARRGFFSKEPVSTSLREEFFAFRVTCFDPAGRRLAVSTVRCSVDLYCLTTGAALPALGAQTSHLDFLSCMAFSPGGGRLATGSADTTVGLLRLSGGRWEEEPRVLEHDGAVGAVCCGGAYLASGGVDGSVRVLNLSSRECECAVENSSGVTALAMDKADAVLYAGFQSGVVKVLALPRGVQLWEVAAHVDSVSALLLTPPVLVSGGGDGVVRTWDAGGGGLRCLQALGGGGGGSAPVTALGAGGGGHVLSGSADGRVRVWSLARGRLAAEGRACGLSQPVAGLHASGEEALRVLAVTLSGLRLLAFRGRRGRGVFGPPVTPCCAVYADPEEARRRPFGVLREEYLRAKLQRRGCVNRRLKESLEPPMLSSSVLVAAIKKRPDVFMEPVRSMVVYGRESVVIT